CSFRWVGPVCRQVHASRRADARSSSSACARRHTPCSSGPSRPTRQEDTMSIIAWIVLGLISGFIASKIVNKTGEGMFLDIALGIVGAVVGGFLFRMVGATGVDGFNIGSMFVAVIGADVVLVVKHAITGARHPPPRRLFSTTP